MDNPSSPKLPFIRAILTLLVPAVILTGQFFYPAADVHADVGDLRWYRLDAPGTVAKKHDIASPSDIHTLCVTGDGKTLYAVDTANRDILTGLKAVYRSDDGGISWNDKPGSNLFQAMSAAERANFRAWDLAVSPDNPNMIGVVTNNSVTDLPRNIWYSPDGGSSWNNLSCPSATTISSLALSTSSSGLVVAGFRSGIGTGTVMIRQLKKAGAWRAQGITADILALQFSTNYDEDMSILCVAADATGSYFNIGFYDAASNVTDWSAAYPAGAPRLMLNGISPTAVQVITASLSTTADFSGQAPALRRCYVNIDDAAATAAGGVYRIDDYAVIRILKATPQKRIATISYHGTYAEGKLLAGEVLGSACKAAVNTWFTDAPATCADSCWYLARKPATGAAGTDNCTGSGTGNARVAWLPDGSGAFCATGSSGTLVPGPAWANPYRVGLALDESALSISRDNGMTWNGLSLIDTSVNLYTDVAPAPDSSTVFLASVNTNPGCRGFDSVWRCLDEPSYMKWERVLCDLTVTTSCAENQTNLASLRMAADYPHGENLAWCITGARRVMLTDDQGQTWKPVIIKRPLADTAYETSKTLYTVDWTAMVQRFSRENSGWVSGPEFSTGLTSAYSIATAHTGMTPDNDTGCIVVGSAGQGDYDIAFSLDDCRHFKQIMKQISVRGNTLVMCSSSFKSDGTILAINQGGMFACSIYSGQTSWEEWWGGIDWPSPVTALAISRNYSMYFNTPASWGSAIPYVRWSAALAGLDSAVSLGTAANPDTRLRISGGLIYGQPILVWDIDQRPASPAAGGLWLYRDTLLWNGPSPVSPSSRSPVGCDTVTGRAGQIELKWNPRSLSRGYQVQIAKDADFRYLVANIGGESFGPYYVPYDLDTPALFIPPGGGNVTDANGNVWPVPALEAGRIYYWRVKVQDVATGDMIKSPISWSESFSIRPGFPVRAPAY